jgi:hypothetical protein
MDEFTIEEDYDDFVEEFDDSADISVEERRNEIIELNGGVDYDD